jgi:hypothetical protein
MSNEKKSIDPAVVAELEQSKNEVLQRIAAKLKDQMDTTCVSAGHSSTTSGHRSSGTHSSHSSH